MVRGITGFKDGKYKIDIREVENGIVHAMFYTKGWRKYRVDLSLEFLKRFYIEKIIGGRRLDMTIHDNGNNFYFERVYFGRRGKFRRMRAKFMVKILAEEYGSVDNFLRQQGGQIPPPGTVQLEIYELLKYGEKDFFDGIERKLGG